MMEYKGKQCGVDVYKQQRRHHVFGSEVRLCWFACVRVALFVGLHINQEIYMISKQFTKSSCIQRREKSPFINIQSCLKGIAQTIKPHRKGKRQKTTKQKKKNCFCVHLCDTQKQHVHFQWHLIFPFYFASIYISIQLDRFGGAMSFPFDKKSRFVFSVSNAFYLPHAFRFVDFGA